MPDQPLVLQASSQGGDWMSVIGRPVSQPPHQFPFPHGTNPSRYALHQAAPPAAQTPNPHAVTSPYHSHQTCPPQNQVECLSSCPSPSCQSTPCIMFPCVQHLLWFTAAQCQLDPGTTLESCWHTHKLMRPAVFDTIA